MLDAEEIRRLRNTANELNNLLQVILEANHYLEKCVADNPNAQIYTKMMRMSIERSAQVTNSMFELAERAKFDIKQTKSLETATAGVISAETSQSKRAAEKLDEGSSSNSEILNPGGQNELILVVEDEQNVNMMVREALMDEGYRALSAKDGFEAIRIYKKYSTRIDLVILDYVMPIMDGGEVFEEMRLINPQVAVVLSSGFTEHDNLRAMLAKGLRGFIPKPYTRQKLLTQVRATLDTLKSKPPSK